MLDAYPDVLGQPYQPYTYEMQSTQKSRTGRSGVSYGYSLFQDKGILPYPGGSFAPFFIDSSSSNQDVQLRFFDVCPDYINYVSVRIMMNDIIIGFIKVFFLLG